MIKTNALFLTGILSFCLLYSGCIYIIAGAGVLGGYAISKDTIQGETDKNFDSIWTASLKVLDILGTVVSEDKQKGAIDAKIDTTKTRVIIEQLTPRTVRMRVSARRGIFPNISLAQKIYIKVIQQAK